jgi:hydrogenase maturation protein HypF
MERRAIAIHGVVQGVGFRPFVYGLAARLELHGFVRNRVGSVWIEVEGEPPILDQFLRELTTRPPPLARIAGLSWEPRPVVGDARFRIEASDGDSTGPVFISPDVATCADCLAELFEPADRRFRYPFLNCTNCGPRLTIIRGAPYDRQRTTMAEFAMCEACRAEYEDPGNRRFHAQPTCCPVCGPRLTLIGALGHSGSLPPCGGGLGWGDGVSTPDPTPPPQGGREKEPIAQVAAALQAGQIVALKGLGGYHLACDARNEAVVTELRRRKHRDEKPFALMVSDAAAAEVLCEVSPPERELLMSPRRPIVLLRRRENAAITEAVAPRNPYLGIMLPYTPIHALLLRELAGMPLVMTSGNRSDEPIAYEDAEAVQRLGGIADLFLSHNRPIHVRCDDSVTRCVDDVELPLRRSRGYAPQPLTLPHECALPTLAVGGQFKGTFALGRGHHAFLSHHLGDLDHFDAYRAFEKDVALYEQLFAISPAVIAHDLHPDYASTRYARQRAAADGLRLCAVQHHHAHMASCMAENQLREPVIGVIFDGTGFGTDGAIWGGEILVGDYHGFRRVAHLRYVGMPGGDQAAREPWRMALAHLIDAGCETDLVARRLPAVTVRTIRQMLERRVNSPPTSSMGRLFDAIAALAGVRDRVSFEGQAAIELEWLATEVPGEEAYPFELEEMPDSTLSIDPRPLLRAAAEDVRRGTAAAHISRRFHSTVVDVVASVCQWVKTRTGLGTVVLSGGVFMNVLLTREAIRRLEQIGFCVHRHQRVPPNDGGLSLGQLAVAALGRSD